MYYNGHTIVRAYGCDGKLVFGEEPPTPVPPITPTGVTFTAVSVTNVEYSGEVCTEDTFPALAAHDVIYGKTGNIKSINVGECIRAMGSDVFNDEINLETVVLPSNVVTINDVLFDNCPSIKTLIIYNTTPLRFYPTVSGYYSSLFGEYDTPPSDFRIYVPAESVETYKTASGWSRYADIIQPIQ